VQAGASGARPTVHPGPTSAPTPRCATYFHVTFVADVAGLSSATDAAGWQGVHEAVARRPCLDAELMTPKRPSDYATTLQAAVSRHSDLIIAGSFLLTDATVEAAIANPSTRFVLVYPLVALSGPPNLSVITIRENEAGFLAGALAGLTTRTNIVGGVYGLEDDHDRRYRQGFERGAQAVNPTVQVLGAFQGARDGPPYANPEWGATQARAFLARGADVLFGSGDLTGQGALETTSEAAKACITVGIAVNWSAEPCLIGAVLLRVDRAVGAIAEDAAGGRWQGGSRCFGVADGVVEIQLGPTVGPDVQARLRTVVVGLERTPS
jgi:basic membrane protein A and related proteins